MPVRVSSSFAHGLIVAALVAPLAWLVFGLLFVVGGTLALWVIDLPLMPWSSLR